MVIQFFTVESARFRSSAVGLILHSSSEKAIASSCRLGLCIIQEVHHDTYRNIIQIPTFSMSPPMMGLCVASQSLEQGDAEI